MNRKKIHIVFAVLTVLTLMFLAANLKKIKYFTSFAHNLKDLPPAVNLTVSIDGKATFKKSFYPIKSNVYLVKNYDVTGKDITLTVNGKTFDTPDIHREKYYNAFKLGKIYIVFTTKDIPFKEFLKLKNASGGQNPF